MQGIASLESTQPNGLYQFEGAANLLADFGREGDTYIVHAAEGETVIPVEVLNANPRMKQMLFKQMEDMGLEPERYIVGNELNSINPVTGQPEFFLKKLFSKVKDVVKKVAPIALPILAPMLAPAMPLALSSGIGGFLGSKIGGASTSDALQNALLSGGLAGVGAKMQTGKFLGSGTDMGIAGLTGGQSTTTGSGEPGFFKKYIYDPAPNTMQGGESMLEKYLSPTRSSISPEAMASKAVQTAQSNIEMTNRALTSQGLPPLSETKVKTLLTEAATKGATADPGMLRKFGPLALTGVAGLALAEAARPDPTDEAMPSMPTGQDLLDEDYRSGAYYYGFDPQMFFRGNPYYQSANFTSPVYAAQGGEIIGPGTATSDSIPAMLSDGEFVMTASAVKGAGGGDRNEGAKKMYSMMRQYERMA